MRKQAAILILLMGVVLPGVNAQGSTGRIRGLVRDEQKKPVINATVQLIRDTSVLKATITDETGRFEFSGLASGSYGLKITSVGYVGTQTGPFELGAGKELTLETFRLKRNEGALDAVAVRGRRPAIEVKPDRTLVNVDASIGNAGLTALEVLKRSPGVSVDKDGNISLKGKSKVLVMLDGKPSYLSGTDLAGLLESMNSNQLDQIEIMTNPPAVYDAAGNAGIINIKTKRNRNRGFNGSVSLGYGQGSYWKTNSSVVLNYRDNSKNIFLNYSFSGSDGFVDLHTLRDYFASDNKTVTAIYDQPTFIKRQTIDNALKLGMDYYLSKKTTLGVQFSGFINPHHADGQGQGYLENSIGIIDSTIRTDSRTRAKVDNGAVNVNFHHAFDSTRELNVDGDFIEYDGKNSQLFINKTSSPNGLLLDSNQLRGELPSQIHIWSFKTDYSQSLGKFGRLAMGWKSSFVKTDNTADYYSLSGTDWTPDYDKTNHFLYSENINAAFVNYNRQRGKWTLQAGLRFENTNYHGHQLGNPQRSDSSFSQHYNNLFPTANASYKVSGNDQIGVAVSRRIDRPAYQDLNPFLFFVNQVTYQTGNPFLKPQYTTSLTVSHTYKDLLTSSVYFSRTDPYFAQLFRTMDGITIFGNYNVGRLDNWGLSEDLQLTPLSWWTLSLHADLIYKKVDGVFNGNVLRTDAVVGLFNWNTQLKIGKQWTGEISGFYNTQDLQDQFDLRPQGQLGIGLSKQVMGGQGTLKANVQDIFYTDISNGVISYQNVREHFVQKGDTRVVNFSFTYRFGKGAKAPARRNGGATDEQSRVKF